MGSAHRDKKKGDVLSSIPFFIGTCPLFRIGFLVETGNP